LSSPTVMTKNSRCGARPTRRSTKASLTIRRGVINRNPPVCSAPLFPTKKGRRRKNTHKIPRVASPHSANTPPPQGSTGRFFRIFENPTTDRILRIPRPTDRHRTCVCVRRRPRPHGCGMWVSLLFFWRITLFIF
jgi:hypothetical protein